jgi:RecB family exonuclease
MDCEYQYYLRYIERVPIKEGAASVYGTAVHRTIKTGYENNLPKEEWVSVFKSEWMALTSKRDIVYNSDTEFLKRFKDGQDVIAKYYDRFVKKKAKPIACELFFGRSKPVTIGNHVMVGVIDQIDANNNVIDYKSGAKPTKMELDLDLQFTIYSYAYRQLFKKEEEGLVLRHLGTMKDMVTTRTESDFELLLEEANKVEKKLKGKVFVRNLGRGCSNCYFLEACLGKERSLRRW